MLLFLAVLTQLMVELPFAVRIEDSVYGSLADGTQYRLYIHLLREKLVKPTKKLWGMCVYIIQAR